jgi:hypothetical protein
MQRFPIIRWSWLGNSGCGGSNKMVALSAKI